MKKFLSLLFLIAMLAMSIGPAAAENAQEDKLLALVGGEELRYSEYAETEADYLNSYASIGYDITDETIRAYIEDVALTAAIEKVLVRQDMVARGCYDFEKETEAWFAERGAAAFDAALTEVGEAIRETMGMDADVDMTNYALAYAGTIGVSEENYVQVYRDQYAFMNYYTLLTADCPVTDQDVQAAYDERVAASRERFENNPVAFEQALAAGEEVWYKPAGYRSVLQILLPVAGETAEAKLAAAQETIAEIEEKLASGASFERMIGEYGADNAFANESFLGIGYQVHRDSVVWDEAFVSAAFSMEKPGDHSAPFASELGVHILYYLADSPEGGVEMTEEIREALTSDIYSTRCVERMNARIDELANSVEVTVY